MKILSVVGARLEFIQVTPVSRALCKDHREILVHTGQHYSMSQTFFDDSASLHWITLSRSALVLMQIRLPKH